MCPSIHTLRVRLLDRLIEELNFVFIHTSNKVILISVVRTKLNYEKINIIFCRRDPVLILKISLQRLEDLFLGCGILYL